MNTNSTFKKNKYVEKRILVSESYADYLKRMESINKDIDWILDIFNGVSEQDKIIYDDEFFTLIPDYKWPNDGPIEKMHLLALVKDLNLRTIRDLRGNDIDLLVYIYKKTLRIIKKNYGISSKNIKGYFHYYPTNYALHIHFVYVKDNDNRAYTSNNHDLKQVIKNLESDGDYYMNNNIEVLSGEKPKKTW